MTNKGKATGCQQPFRLPTVRLVTLTIVVLALALATTACNDDKTPDPECDCIVKAHNAPCTCDAAGTPACDCTVIQRTFTIDGFVKPITVTDARTGDNDTDLETLGVISRLKTALQSAKDSGNNKFEPVINRGITIVVEETTAYEYFNVYSGNKLGANIAYALSDDKDFALLMEFFIESMSNNQTLSN
jgi:hypothetical protein